MVVGPVGLLVESVVWHGMKIDAELRIWQRKEEPIIILKVPYQNLKPLILKAAGRSRNRAEWHRGVSSKRGRAPLEIDDEVSQVVATFEEEEKGLLRVVQMGGTQALNEIADYNQDVGRICNYCMEAISTSDHVKWERKHVDATRKEIDAELADIPHKLLPSCIKNGIAPGMKAEGKKTYWGAELGDDISKKTRKPLGENLALHTPGSDARKTEERQAAFEITEDPEVAGFNARQIMLRHKEAHGSGQDLVFPGVEEIEKNKEGHPEGHMVATEMEATLRQQSGGQPWEGLASGSPTGTKMKRNRKIWRPPHTMVLLSAKRERLPDRN